MPTLPSHVQVLSAPANLGLSTRVAFREEANALLDALPSGEGVLRIDFSRTGTVDSSGLNALVLIQRRAAEQRQQVTLLAVSAELRFLLALTHLESLFGFEANPA